MRFAETKLAAEFNSAIETRGTAGLHLMLRGTPVSPGRLTSQLIHTVLGALMVPMRALVNLRYSIKRGSIIKLSVPVISVGNITYGGSGKSPFCRWLVRRCLEMGFKVGIVLPSHRRLLSRQQLTEDELLEHSYYLQNVPVVIGRRREEAAMLLIETHGCQAVFLDDGFQYRLLHRDLDIVLIDAIHVLHPFCPTIREPLSALRRADIVCLTKVNAARSFFGERHLNSLESMVKALCPERALVKADYSAVDLIGVFNGEPMGCERLLGAKVVGVVGTAEPLSFFFMLHQLGINVLKLFVFEDHHPYSLSDLAMLREAMQQVRADLLVTTMKDAMRFRKAAGGFSQLLHSMSDWYAMRIDIHLISGSEILEATLRRVLQATKEGVSSYEH